MATTFQRQKPVYDNTPRSNCEVALTSFYGGMQNGRSLQLTLSDELSSKYACLTNEDVEKLRDGLNKWLTHKALEEV